MSETASNKAEDATSLETQRETFVASLSHDLKNPTIAQIRILELFLKGKFGIISQSQQEILKMLLDSCKYMNAMLGSFLTTYRSEKGMITLDNDKVFISSLVVECYEEIIYLAQDKNIQTQFINNSSNDSVWGDKVQLRRVVMNLLTNGIKYAYKDSFLYIRIFNDKNYVYFEYENKSSYLSDDKRKQIFAKYFSYTEAHETFGIGLGLYASKKIIEAHDGEIYVHSYTDNRNIIGFKIPYGMENLKKRKTVTF